MNQIIQLLQQPIVWKVLLSYFLFSAVVGALPRPGRPSDSASLGVKFIYGFYQFLFAALHGLAGNLNRAAIAFKVPGAPNDSNGNGNGSAPPQVASVPPSPQTHAADQ